MVDPHRNPAQPGWTMSQDQIERFVGMERDIKQLRQDVTELEADLKEMNRKLDRIEKALAEGRGQSATWPRAGALLMGSVVVLGALGGWVLALWKMASGGP